MYFYHHFDLSKYMNEIWVMFNRIWSYWQISDINKMIDLGFDITELYTNCDDFNNSALRHAFENENPEILEYLLSHNINHKKYELEAIQYCIKFKSLPLLDILIKNGFDLRVLNNVDTSSFTQSESRIKLYNLLTQHNIDPLIVALSCSTLTQEDYY